MYSNADFFEDGYVSKKEKRQSRKQKRNQREFVAKPVIRVKPILPLTKNQERTFEAFEEGKHLLLHGSAGTGKTFIALGLALGAVSDGDAPKPIIILRSVVPTRDMGFLPGKLSEKIAVYEESVLDPGSQTPANLNNNSKFVLNFGADAKYSYSSV